MVVNFFFRNQVERMPILKLRHFQLYNGQSYLNMGQEQPQSSIATHRATSLGHTLSLLTPPDSSVPNKIMRTLHLSSPQHLATWRHYLTAHRRGLENSQEMTRLVEVVEEEGGGLMCGNGNKLHLVYEYSPKGMGELIAERRREGGAHFSYQDICNILYSCLGALWWAEQSTANCPQPQLARHRTVFVSTRHMLVMGQGTLKIMDPLLHSFKERHIRCPQTYYSPEKLADFEMTDDTACAIFELGMTLLEVSLLEPIYEAYYKDSFLSDVVDFKIGQVKEQYLVGQKDSVFDLIHRMVQTDRQHRITLQQAIQFAENIYQQHEGSIQSSNVSPPMQSSQSKQSKQQERTRDSSGRKQTRGHFQEVRDWMISERDSQSPSVTNFTIQEVSREREEHSSMLGSLTVDHPSYDLTHSSLHTGVFQGLSLGESYRYHCTEQGQGELFTPPALLELIDRQLQEIKVRAQERRKRRESVGCSPGGKISNQVYLEQ